MGRDERGGAASGPACASIGAPACESRYSERVDHMDYGRLVTAMATPFDETGAVDGKAVGRLVDHLVETGTTALVVAGTTGESPTLSHDEKRTLFRLTVAAAAGRIPVIAGTGGN